jgi:predicted nuclease of predicted toxin-antitoxin system
MTKETFRYIEYSDKNKFTKTNNTGRIELKKYTDDLLFYVDFDSTFNARYSEGDATATITGTATNENSGVFGQFGWLQNGSVEWSEQNFIDLQDEGCIKFRLRPTFINVSGRQNFVRTTNPIITSVPVVDNTIHKFGGACLNLLGNQEKRVSYNVDNVATTIQTGAINFFFKSDYTGTPTNNIGFIDIKNVADNNNRIIITHETDGKIYARIYDQVGTLIVEISFAWAADSNWHEFELNFDLNIGESRIFIDGIQYGATDNNIGTRINVNEAIYVGATTGYTCGIYIDDLAIFSTPQHTIGYKSRTIAFSGTESNIVLYAKYDTSLNLTSGIGTLAYLSTTPINNKYGIKLTVAGVLFGGGDTKITLVSGDTINDIRNKLEVAITGSGASTIILPEGNIRVYALTDGATILIEDPDTGQSLIDLLDGVITPEMPNAPTTDVNLFDFYNSNNNRIILIHDTESHLILKMYNSFGTLTVNQNMGLWNNNEITWYAFELNWNKSIGQFFKDGELFSVFQTGFTRGGTTKLKISSGTTDFL